jgi:6,7-dimethyl-8-ribityllumazine synthase
VGAAAASAPLRTLYVNAHGGGLRAAVFTAQVLARAGRHAAIVALGCVVRGETRHYEHVADETARGLMQVSLEHALPVANGVLAVEKHADAEARAGGAHGNKGEEAALAALEMAWLLHKLGPSLSMPVRLPAREASR